jgi:formiminotetrahydrofolate cyclodeaminase
LVAYNVYLNTPDVEIARKIGKAVRFSNGGLRYLKGMGVGVRGLAQVSMNLTDADQTPIARVYEYVKREAARYGVMPLSSEIVGLIPKKALEDAAEWFLQIENFDASLILENRLAGVMSGKMAVGGLRAGVEPFIEQLAAPTAAPGGGCAAAAAGAMAAALGGMVAGMSRGKKAYLQHEHALSYAIARLAEIREQLKAAVDADAAAFHEVMAAFKKLKEDPAAQAGIDEATKQATLVPLSVAESAKEALTILESLRDITNPKMASDISVGIALANAAIVGALANVEINLSELKEPGFLAEIGKRVSAVKA